MQSGIVTGQLQICVTFLTLSNTAMDVIGVYGLTIANDFR